MNLNSVPVSLNTLTGLAATCGHRLRTIIANSLHASASNEILALSNEVNDLRIVFYEVEAIHHNISGPQSSMGLAEDFDTRASHLLGRAQSILLELDELISSCVKLGHGNALIFRRAVWPRKRNLSIAMTNDLRQIKQNIVLIMASKTAAEVHRVRLRLLGLDFSQPTPIYNELAAPSGRVQELPYSEMLQGSVAFASEEHHFPEQTPYQSELRAIPISYGPMNMDDMPPARTTGPGAAETVRAELNNHSTQPIELGTDEPQLDLPQNNLFRRRAFRVRRQVNQTSILDLARDSGVPEVYSIPDFLEVNGHSPRQYSTPEKITISEAEHQDLSRLAPEHIMAATTGGIQQRQSPVIRFHCSILSSCEGHCSCICHSKRRYQSPRMFSNLVGTLFIGYTGLPVSALGCDLDTCVKQTPRDFRAIYTFPAWFVMKALDFTAKILSSNGLCFGLIVRNRIDGSAGVSIISLAIAGDGSGILELLTAKRASLTDVEKTSGVSPFHAALQVSQFSICHLLLDIGYDPCLANDIGFELILERRTDIQLLCRRMLFPQNIPSHESEYRNIVHRMHISPFEVLELSYIHQIITGMIEADLGSILLDNEQKHEISHRDCMGMTPLHWAALRANISALATLLRARVDVETRDDQGTTALHYAAMSGSQRCVELLLIAGSSIHARCSSGYPVLHLAVMCTSGDNTGILDTLLMAGADPNSRSDSGTSPLQFACAQNKVLYAEALIAAGARIKEVDDDVDTTLFYAVHYRSVEAVELLLSHGADFYGLNKHGHTILHQLAIFGTIGVMKLFLPLQLRGLDVEKKDKSGKTAWETLLGRPALSEEVKQAFEALLAKCRADNAENIETEVVELEG